MSGNQTTTTTTTDKKPTRTATIRSRHQKKTLDLPPFHLGQTFPRSASQRVIASIWKRQIHFWTFVLLFLSCWERQSVEDHSFGHQPLQFSASAQPLLFAPRPRVKRPPWLTLSVRKERLPYGSLCSLPFQPCIFSLCFPAMVH